jgi:phage-related protein
MRQSADKGGRDLGRHSAASIIRFAGPLAVAGIIAGAVAGTAALIAPTIKEAGALEQSVGAIQSVFKESAGEMLEWSKGAATSVGLTQNAYNELGTLIGAQLKNAGTAMDELGPQTNNLIGLGADLASMFGGTTKEAVEAISSALKGERDPIERYGVSLNQARIDAKAAELGFQKVGGTLSQQANAAATLALLMEQTTDAHGNFAKEATTYEGVMQRLGASWGNVTATVGKGFLPVATAAGSILLESMPAVQGLADRFAALAPAIQGVVEIIRTGDFRSDLFASMGIEEDSRVIGFLFDVRNGVLDLFSAMAAGSPDGVAEVFTGLAEGVSGWISEAFTPLILPTIVDAFTTGMAWWMNVYAPIVLAIEVGVANAVLSIVPDLSVAVWHLVFQIAEAILRMLPTTLTAATTLFLGLVQAVAVALPQVVSALVNALPTIARGLIGMLPGLLTAALSLFSALLTALTTIQPLMLKALIGVLPAIADTLLALQPAVLGAAINLFLGLVAAWLMVLPKLIVSLLEALPQIVATLLGMLPGLVTTAIDLFFGLVTGLLQMLPDLLTAIVGMLPTLVSTIMSLLPLLIETAVQLFSALITGLLQNLGPLVNTILTQVIPALIGALIGAVPQLLEAGVNLIGGLVQGLWRAASSVGEALLSIIGGAVDGFLGFLGIHSPSRLFRGFGVNIGEGLVGGIAGMASELHAEGESQLKELAGASPDVGGGVAGAYREKRAAEAALDGAAQRRRGHGAIVVHTRDPRAVADTVLHNLGRTA